VFQPLTEVRDPIHGAITLDASELSILDHPLVQRLRHIKQLGFSDLSFPGATHNRYLHSVGAMHLGGRAFEALFTHGPASSLSSERRRSLRRLVRTAALLHDVGHAPFSHASEFAMPLLEDLDVGAYKQQPELYPGDRQATHEDYTVKIITDSSLTGVLEEHCQLPAGAVAGLIDPKLPVERSWYEADGINWRPLLQQLISSELDVDRMDYLARDSHFAGVHYGVFDVGWLMNHLGYHLVEDSAYLALEGRAIYAFDDFLIARYHMFLMVYFHHRSVGYEEMLKRYLRSGGDGYALPAAVENYADYDDNQLTSHLRASTDEWARRIVERREYKLLIEQHGDPSEIDLSPALSRLDDAGIPTITAASKGVLSKYFARRQESQDVGQGTLPLGVSASSASVVGTGTPPIFVLQTPYRGAENRLATQLEESTDLFDRYARQLLFSRIYVPPEQLDRASELMAGIH